MKTESAPLLTVRPGQWRQLASALRGIEDFDRFNAAMQAAISGLEGNWQLNWSPPGHPPQQYELPGLQAPIEVEGRIAGNVSLGAPRRFGPDDMYLLGELAEFLSAALALSIRARKDAERRSLLRLLLDQAPVGIAAFREREIIAANGLAERWLSELGTQWLANGAQVHQGSVSGRLIYAEVRETAALNHLQVAVLHDLSPQQARLLESLQTAYYRAKATNEPSTFLMLEARQAGGLLFRSQSDLHKALGQQARVGPYDSTRLGAIVGDCGASLRAKLRSLRSAAFWPHGSVSIVDLAEASDPEDALSRATASPRSLGEFLRPRVLLADDSSSVQVALETMLGDRAEVIRVDPPRAGEQLLRPDIDAALIDYKAVAGSARELMELARLRAPGLRLAYSVSSPLSEDPTHGLPSLSKPFVREDLYRALLPPD